MITAGGHPTALFQILQPIHWDLSFIDTLSNNCCKVGIFIIHIYNSKVRKSDWCNLVKPQQRMPIPMAMKVPNVPPLCIIVFPTPPISSRPLIPILRQENVPNIAPAAIPTAKPIMKPIFTLSKQLGWACPYGPTATGIFLEFVIRVFRRRVGETRTQSWI